MNPVSAILCADWSAYEKKRAVYLADVAGRMVTRIEAAEWSLAKVLDQAEQWTSRGSVLATFDAPLGVPESYLNAAARVLEWRSPRTFLELLESIRDAPDFFVSTGEAKDWSIERPF